MIFPSFGQLAATLGVLGSLPWIALLIDAARHHRKAVRLADLTDAEPPEGWPGLAVVIAARDEEPMIAEAVRSLLGQDYPALEVIAVDDRSADRTGPILDAIARDDPRLRVVHLADLPEGWLGKTHALQRGSEATSAPWILFTDGDVVFAPGALRRAVAQASRLGVDHLVAFPDAVTVGVAERSFMALFVLLFSMRYPLWRVDDPASRAYVGVGAFNLVRAEAFRAIGGFRRVALSIDDDTRLGQALKYAGYRNAVVIGTGQIRVRWQVGLDGLVRGLEKNFFAGVDFRPLMAVVAVLTILVVTLGPPLGLVAGPIWSRVVSGLGVAATVALVAASAPSEGIGPLYAFTLPFAGPVMAFALARSAVLTLARGGVSWRGRLYPLSDLRAHVALRNHWLREVWYSTR